MLNRRGLLGVGVAVPALMVAGRTAAQGAEAATAQAAGLSEALHESDLVYLSPRHSDGRLSRCQAEVWFAYVDGAVFVVTASDAWRTRAIERGLVATQLWVGDVGQWRSSDGAYLKLPELRAEASVVRDVDAQNKVLDAMGKKYRLEWVVWGPRFRNGLADGSRAMLRYQPT